MSTATHILDIVYIETGLDPAAIVKVSQVMHKSEDCTCAELGDCLWTLFVGEAAVAVKEATREILN